MTMRVAVICGESVHRVTVSTGGKSEVQFSIMTMGVAFGKARVEGAIEGTGFRKETITPEDRWTVVVPEGWVRHDVELVVASGQAYPVILKVLLRVDYRMNGEKEVVVFVND